MNVEQMRAEISKVYPGKKWKRKVAGMYEDQVIAVYHNFLRSGKFDQESVEPVVRNKRDKIREDRKNRRKFEATYDGVQMSIDDLL